MAMCSVEGCGKPAKARGWCTTHYARWRKTGNPLGKIRHRNKCSVDGCNEWCYSHGYCPKHAWRQERYGSPFGVKSIALSTAHPYEYTSYKSMKARCLNPNASGYHNYGGRGIKICDRWLGQDGFRNFLEDMGERPFNFSLDRIDPSKGYCPENCRWANWKTQGANRRGTAMITYKGKTQNLKEWSAELGLPYKALVQRRYYGWSVERMFIQPIRKREKP